MLDTVFTAFKNSDGVGQLIVIALLVCSCIATCTAVNKISMVLACRNRCERFRKKYKEHANTAPLRISTEMEKPALVGPLSYITYSALDAMERMLQMEGYQHYALMQQGTLPRSLTDAEIEKLRTVMNNAMSYQEMELEDGMSLISCLATLAPMCGLFGTVWGVMGTFIGIVANGGRPDIQAIAPGISGALLTTIAGLVVAIPAIAMNTWIVSTIQKIEISMQTYIEEFISSIRISKVSQPQQPQMQQQYAPQGDLYAQPQNDIYAQPQQPQSDPYAAPRQNPVNSSNLYR